MLKKIFLTFLFTMVLAFVALFASTQVLAQQTRIAQHVLPDVELHFLGPDEKMYEARIKRNVLDPVKWEVKLFRNREDITNFMQKPKGLEEFSFCEQNEKGKVTIDGKQYSCHVLKAASDGAFLIGNHSCPYTLNPPGIVINLCPHPHPHPW